MRAPTSAPTSARTRARSAAAIAIALLACATPAALHAACSPLTSGVAVTTTATDSYWQFTQTDAYWTAVGVRPPAGTDWDMYMYTPGVNATCTTTLLANSVGTSGVDFVIGDFNPGRNTAGTYTAGAHMFSGGGTGTIEWDSGPDLLQINDPRVDVSTGPGDVLHVWDVYLTAGTTYVFSISHPTGTADSRLLLFRNTTGGTYWVGRSSAQFETTSSTSYTAPSDGYYGVVVVNDNGQTGTYGVMVGSCTGTTALTAGTPVSVYTAENWFSFDQQDNYWTGVAVRGTGSDDWDISVNSAAGGGSWPVCESGNLATSAGVPPSVDFVVGDFNYNATGTYYVRANLFLQEGSGPATVQWDSGADQLVMNAPLIKRNLTSSQLIEVWDVFLQTGSLYTLSIDNNGGTGPLMTYVFEPSGGTQWAGPSNAYAAFQTPPGYSVTGISPPVTGWYGIVVVNTQASTGFYGIGMGTCAGVPVTTLARRTPTSGTNQSNFYDIGVGADPLGPYWQAAGVRGDIWQVGAYDPTSASTGWPYCFSNYFKTSSIGFQTVELAVGDLESCPPAPGALVGINAFQVFAGAAAPVSVEWDKADTNLPLGVALNAPIGSSTILRAYRVSLAAGQPYTFTFASSPVNLGHMYLFHPGGCSPAYWATNADAVLSLSHGSLPYTPATSGDYLVVVTNEIGASGTYGISVNAGTTAVDEPGERVTQFAAITPNPGRGDAQLEFTLAGAARVAFDVVDLAGRRVATVGDASYEAGHHALAWEARSGAASLAPGVYLVRMRVDGRAAGQRKYTVLP